MIWYLFSVLLKLISTTNASGSISQLSLVLYNIYRDPVLFLALALLHLMCRPSRMILHHCRRRRNSSRSWTRPAVGRTPARSHGRRRWSSSWPGSSTWNGGWRLRYRRRRLAEAGLSGVTGGQRILGQMFGGVLGGISMVFWVCLILTGNAGLVRRIQVSIDALCFVPGRVGFEGSIDTSWRYCKDGCANLWAGT